MSVAAIGAYHFPARDTAARFPAPLLCIGWDQHMMFCAPLCLPVPGETRFAELIDTLLPRLYGEHPDFARIRWPEVQWFHSATMFIPAPQRTLAEQGFKHKSLLRFRTPGLEGLRGSCG